VTTEGQRIKLIRKKLGYTQKEFAEILGFQESFMSSIETSRKFLSREKLLYLLEKFNININYLLAGIEPIFLTKRDKQLILPDDELYAKFKEFMKEYEKK
jgi:transcriptional regulator with XRE-family HTH domain